MKKTKQNILTVKYYYYQHTVIAGCTKNNNKNDNDILPFTVCIYFYFLYNKKPFQTFKSPSTGTGILT